MKIVKHYLIVAILALAVAFPVYAGEWKHDEKGYWYQNDDGSYKIGWYQDIDDKWYYFDEQTGNMLVDKITPDGYYVDENGVWDGRSKLDTAKMLEENYNNKIELVVTSSTIDRSTFQLPVTIYFNNEYENTNGRKMYISGVELAKDGIPYIKYGMSEESYVYELTANCVYELDDGTYLDKEETVVSAYCDFANQTGSDPLYIRLADRRPVSAVVYIDMK